jgi:hypothetical protein
MVMAVATALAVAAVYAGRKFREIAKILLREGYVRRRHKSSSLERSDYWSKAVTPLASWEGV